MKEFEMRENLTNAGKKEQRQINQLLTKEAQAGNGRGDGKEVEARTIPKQHRLKGHKSK
jgi:hypothetical protein